MPNYKSILEKLNLASEDENNLHCIKVLDQLTSLFKTMELKSIPKEHFKLLIKRLEQVLKKETIYVKQLTAIKVDTTEILRKEFGLTTRFHYRFRMGFNGFLVFGLPLALSMNVFNSDIVFLSFAFPLSIIFGYLTGFYIGKRKDDMAAKKGTRLEVI